MSSFAWHPPAYFGKSLARAVPGGGPLAASKGVFARGHPNYSACPSRGSRPTRSSIRTRVLRSSHLSALPRGAQCMKRDPRPALHMTAQGW
eukprot:8035683-Pyramimonas_sp.AAC.1